MSDMSHEQMLLDKYHKMVDNANNEAWKVEELEKRNKELLVSKNALYKEVEEMVTERDTLKEENEKLKEERHKVIQDAYQSHYDTWKAEQENIVITELKEEIEDLEEELNDKKLLMVSDGVGGVVNVREIMKQMDICRFVKEKNDKLEEDNKKLKELTDGIMNEPGTGHILGCNAYEKFCQAMSELNYDEKWIGELMLEEAENDTEEDILVSIQDELLGEVYEPSFHKLLPTIKKLKECLLGYWSDGMLGNTEAWTPPATWQTMLDEANDAN